MSEHNLEAVRRWLGWGGLQAPAEHGRVLGEMHDLIDSLWAEDSDYYPVRAVPGATPCHGRDEVKAFMTSFWDAWDTWWVTLVDAQTFDDVRALGHTHVRGVGKGSGLDLDGAVFHAFWFRGGRILRLEDHQTERGALVGLGLEA